MHECEISIELQYARLAYGCYGHLTAERQVSRGVSRHLLRELSNDVVAVVTVVTALTSDTSHKWSCCCLQVDGQPSRLLRTLTPFSNASARNSHFAFSLHAARSSFQEQEMMTFLCVKYLCHAFGNFQFTYCIGFLIFYTSYNVN